MPRTDQKGYLRKLFKEKRDLLSLERRKEASASCCRFLRSKCKDKGLVLSFGSFGSEIDLWPFNFFCMQKLCLALPRVEEAGIVPVYFERKEDLVPSVYGLLEPCSRCHKIELDRVELILIPGLCFDQRGHRLGYGKGYYDSLLSNIRLQYLSIPTWGLGYKEQMSLDLLPIEEHDVAVSEVFLF